MIRTLAVAAAAAVVGYKLGQRAGDDDSDDGINSVPTPPTGNAVGVSKDDIENPYGDWEAFDEDGRVGR